MRIASRIKSQWPLLKASIATIGIMSLSTPSFSQTPEEVFNAYFKDWFQVEIIIFERLESSGEDPEAWPKNVELKYPANVEFLVNPNAVPSGDANNNPDETFASRANGGDANPSPTAEEIAKNREFLALLKKSGNNDAFTKKILSALSESEIARLTPKEIPYHFLDDSLQQLGDQARRLGRDRKMRLLFHNAWRQPFYAQEQAPALVITGGDLYEDHYELEGTITLSLSRYLHIHTNLWLTQFDANTGRNEEHWRWLPDRPKPTIKIENGANESTDLNIETTQIDSAALNTSGLNAESLNENQMNTNTFGSFDDLPSLNMGLDSDNLGFDFGNNSSTTYFDDLGNFIEHPYVIRQIVTIKQKRRMRSGELHYIDHPRLGILLRIDPYQPKFTEVPQE